VAFFEQCEFSYSVLLFLFAQPNVTHNLRQVITRSESKPLYAYADTFSSPFDSGNKDYYIASIFTHLHMQHKGELSLFGMLAQQFFLRGTHDYESRCGDGFLHPCTVF
jgi:hypothetical protein